jgi:hypothetical protein
MMGKKDKYNVLLEEISKLSQDDFDKLLDWMIMEFNSRNKARIDKIRRAFNDKY